MKSCDPLQKGGQSLWEDISQWDLLFAIMMVNYVHIMFFAKGMKSTMYRISTEVMAY